MQTTFGTTLSACSRPWRWWASFLPPRNSEYNNLVTARPERFLFLFYHSNYNFDLLLNYMLHFYSFIVALNVVEAILGSEVLSEFSDSD